MIPSNNTLLGNYRHDKMNIGSGPHNEYMPLYTTRTIRKVGDSYIYHAIANNSPYYNVNSYSKLYESLTGETIAIQRFIKANVNVMPGYMWNPVSGDPLLMLAINSVNWYDDAGMAKPKYFRLYISTSLVTSNQYKNLWKNIQKNYLPYFHENRIPVIITTSKRILQETMNDGITLKFDNLSQKMNAIEAIRSSYGKTN